MALSIGWISSQIRHVEACASGADVVDRTDICVGNSEAPVCNRPVDAGVHAQLWQGTLCAAALRGEAGEFVKELGRAGRRPGQRQCTVLEVQQNGSLIEQADCS